MAVQQNKKSPSKRGMHRSHNALVTPGIAVRTETCIDPSSRRAKNCAAGRQHGRFHFSRIARCSAVLS